MILSILKYFLCLFHPIYTKTLGAKFHFLSCSKLSRLSCTYNEVGLDDHVQVFWKHKCFVNHLDILVYYLHYYCTFFHFFVANCITTQEEIDLASCIYTCQVFVYKQCNEKPVFYVSTKLKDVNCLQ